MERKRGMERREGKERGGETRGRENENPGSCLASFH